MAGFLINGCGVAESYYKIMDLSTAYCPRCKKQRLWELSMLKVKIRVVFIPTVSVNTKYAVMCSGCGVRYYVSEEQKDFILKNSPSCVEVRADGVVIHGFGQASQPQLPASQPQASQPQLPASQPQASQPQLPAPQPQASQLQLSASQPQLLSPRPQAAQPGQHTPRPQAIQAQPAPAFAPPGQPEVQAASSGFEGMAFACPGCGRQMQRGKRFCGHCGASLQAHMPQGQRAGGQTPQGQKVQAEASQVQKQAQAPQNRTPQVQAIQGQMPRKDGNEDANAQMISRLGRRKICPKCQMVFMADKENCNICGSRLADKP